MMRIICVVWTIFLLVSCSSADPSLLSGDDSPFVSVGNDYLKVGFHKDGRWLYLHERTPITDHSISVNNDSIPTVFNSGEGSSRIWASKARVDLNEGDWVKVSVVGEDERTYVLRAVVGLDEAGEVVLEIDEYRGVDLEVGEIEIASIHGRIQIRSDIELEHVEFAADDEYIAPLAFSRTVTEREQFVHDVNWFAAKETTFFVRYQLGGVTNLVAVDMVAADNAEGFELRESARRDIWDPPAFARELLRLHNIERTKSDLEPLRLDKRLMRSSEKFAAVNAEEKGFGHNVDGSDLGGRVRVEGFSNFYTIAENIAYGQRNEREVTDGWMESAGHRRNILNPAFERVGFGVESGKDPKYGLTVKFWVSNFGTLQGDLRD